MSSQSSWREAVESLSRDLDAIVGPRLRALVVYEAHGLAGDMAGSSESSIDADIRHEDLVHALAVVEGLSVSDWSRLAALAPAWEKRHLAVPLFLSPGELARSFDAFPLEFAQILARHVVVAGEDPFQGMTIDREDLRRACETQTRSHLLHLREGYLQTGGDSRKVAELLAASARPLRALLVNIARLHGVNARSSDALVHFVQDRLHLPADGLRPVVDPPKRSGKPGSELADAFPAHLDAIERLAKLVDEWTV